MIQSTSGSGQVILDDGSGSGTSLNGNGGSVSLTAGTGGIVEAATNTTGTADLGNAAAITLTSGGTIGASGEPVQLASASLTTNTTTNSSSQFLSEIGTATLVSAGAGSGTVDLSGGVFNLSGNNQVDASATLEVDAGSFGISTFNDKVAKLTINGGTVSGTTGVLTSTATIDARSGSVGATLAGTNGLTKTTAGTLALTRTQHLHRQHHDQRRHDCRRCQQCLADNRRAER